MKLANDILLNGALVLIVLAGALLLVRIWRGPSMLDRAVSVDIAAVLIIAGIGVNAAITRTSYYLSIMLVIAFLGFTSSVAIARFIAARDRPGVRPRSGIISLKKDQPLQKDQGFKERP
ncbi:monovalent cation/H+ antiporter complex subunit F [Streptomyces sp. BH097]|uniref:monovalent cation/H+ antiporter complex subunit F n=1 Tax=unclassified Streptomyces TaxID=2593676 RepID=UPI003BB542B1